MNNIYEVPRMEIVEVKVADVITTSGIAGVVDNNTLPDDEL